MWRKERIFPTVLIKSGYTALAEYHIYASVAQLDRALASDARCRWFESSRARQKEPLVFTEGFF